ncbi:MAG: hypothetical protein AAF564_18450 [Bacteroidota bacterium]
MAETIARYILGTIFLVFGLNGFYTFIPIPEFHPFMEILVTSGYIYIVKGIEVVAAVMLLTNRYVQLSLAILTPVVVNIAIYHALLDERNWQITPIILLLTGYLLYTNRQSFQHLFKPKNQ